MGACPEVDLVGRDFRIGSGLVCGSKVVRHVEPSGVIETVDPGLGIWLGAFDGSDVVRLAEVVPSNHLDHWDLVAGSDDRLPTGRVELVRKVNELKKYAA